MSSNAAASAQSSGAGAAGPRQPETPENDWKKTMMRSVMMYFVVNGLISWYTNKGNNTPSHQQQSSDGGQAGSNGVDGIVQDNVQKPFGSRQTQPLPEVRLTPGTTSLGLYAPNLPLDIYLIITEGSAPSHEDLATQRSRLIPGGRGSRNLTDIETNHDAFTTLLSQSQPPNNPGAVQPVVWTPSSVSNDEHILGAALWRGVLLNDSNAQHEADLSIRVPEKVKADNASIWAEIFMGPTGRLPDKQYSLRTRKLLTRLYPERKERIERNLFDKSNAAAAEAEAKADNDKGTSALPFLDKEPARLIGWWHNNLTVAIVKQDPKVELPITKLPPPLLQHIHVQEDEKGEAYIPSSKKAVNYPVVFPNDFWHLRQHMHPINATHETLPLHVSLYMTSFFKFQMLAAWSDSFEKQSMAASEVDMIKLTLIENNPWYLGLTIAVSILHSLFEFLAFSSDVSHWRKKDNMAGVSIGSILTNVFVQLVILLYLLDQAQDTSWMILASQAVGIVIEAWKVTKAVTVSVVARKRGEGSKYLHFLPYRIDIRDNHVLSEEERKTQEFDKLAFRIVAMVAVPLLGAYTVYSALYQSHKGWWSFVIGTLCSFVYAFGFASLIPQLIVNYKLKSTAGMNSRTFVYKILGTFVDDLFAFAIRQPWLHRLACFRDDIVFLIFLYQRWIYGVDPTRVNEFGQVLESGKDKKKQEEEKPKDQAAISAAKESKKDK